MMKPASRMIPLISIALFAAVPALGQEVRVDLKPGMVVSEAEHGNPEAMVDEQQMVGNPPSGAPKEAWSVPSQHNRIFPVGAHFDLGRERNLSNLWIYDTFNIGEMTVWVGKPGQWTKVVEHTTRDYQKWVKLPLDATTRYLRITREKPSAIFAEIAIYEYTPEAHAAMLARKEAEAKARAQRDAAIAKAKEEEARRPRVDLGEPFGEAVLVDEIDSAAASPTHGFSEDPPGASRVETILGRPCRVLAKTPDEAAYFAYRIGRFKLLKPGAAYLLEVEYPEDAPRSVIVMNGGNETSRGFHTGATFGDAFHPKYVDNNNESLRIPLSGKYERWQLFFNLHDRFPQLQFIRGDGDRPLTPEDGFPVVIAQFSAADIPVSRGAAVSRIRLYEVADAAKLAAKVNLPPDGLPRRHIFWREEMADGVISAEKPEQRGLTEALDWYRYKANQMKLLGMRTFCKDLLEFGACQGWDSSDGGGNQWVYFNYRQKDLWQNIVAMMGREGFEILPYYEYSGSKGQKGLGNQRRAKPLTRDDAYTHITWIESASADITDPDTYADFKKMLDLTIVRYKDQAKFVGAWLRPRAQIPIGFGDAALKRFSAEANDGKPVTRRDLIADKTLLARYYDWWYGKRREFLAAMRDHLRASGVNPDAVILFTATMGEPGVSFPTWDKQFVTDDVPGWTELLKDPAISKGLKLQPLSIDDVSAKDLYLKALLAAPLNWGNWEWHHSSPPADPQRYKQTEGILLTHCINRAYTVGSPKTFELFRAPAGLAAVRHYTLNENMMFDKKDQPKLGYFVADVERAGPYCMLAEARAMANGDPTHLGYLIGSNFGRGFPKYVREFNQAFLALPALPSKIVESAASDPEVVVRAVSTPKDGTYLAVVNTGLSAKDRVTVRLPVKGALTDAATGEKLNPAGGEIAVSLYPCQLRALRVE